MEKFKQYLLATALLAFAQLLLVPCLVMAQTVTPAVPVVIDATDKTVSNVLGIDLGIAGAIETTFVWVALKVDDRVVTLIAHRNGFASDDRLVFTSANCSTTPLMVANNDLYPPVVVAGTDPSQLGNALYVPDLDDTPQTITIESVLDTLGGRGCISGNRGDEMVVSAIRIADLDNHFTTPFTIQAQEGEDLAALQQQVDGLEGNLVDHRHGYRTGKGRGHNNTRARTGSAVFPAP